jgi:SAM-dependent methyltransferase
MKLDAAVAAREQFERFFSHRDSHGKSDDQEYAILKQVYESLDLERYEEIRSSLLSSRDAGSEVKYLDLLYWLRSKLRIALEQKMHERPPLRLLDLGAGAGHFPFLCRRLGHRVTALDLGHIEVYNRLIAFFEVDRIDFEIRPLQPLPRFGERFDLVTGFMVGFNKKSKNELWGEPEWLYFLRDLGRNVMSDEGRLVLKLIRNNEKAGWHFYDRELMNFARAHGGSVGPENGYMIFETMDAFRN